MYIYDTIMTGLDTIINNNCNFRNDHAVVPTLQ